MIHWILCGSLLALNTTAYTEPTKPNVLMISIDDMNDWVGFMNGHPNTKTPHMDRLAASGTVFMNAHTASPHCGPARTGLMSGLRPSTTGVYGLIPDRLLEKTPAGRGVYLSNWFENNGYKTMGKGKVFHHSAPIGAFQEFDRKREEPRFGPKPRERFTWNEKGTSTDWGVFLENDEEYPDVQVANWAVNQLRKEHDEPFFMAVGFILPHVPWHAPKKWFDLHPLDSIELPPYMQEDMDDIPEIGKQIAKLPQMPTTEWMKENREWKKVVQAYLATISMVDHCVGKVIQALEESDHPENTVVILWSDHGYHLGEKNRVAKMSLWERSTRIPLIITAPGYTGGQSTDAPASLMDVYPTLLNLCGLPENTTNEGVSLVHLMQNPDVDWPHYAVSTFGENNHSVRSKRYSYIQYEDGSEELYDHLTDPNQWQNLANNPEFAPIKTKLKRSLPTLNAKWSEHTANRSNRFFTEKTENARK